VLVYLHVSAIAFLFGVVVDSLLRERVHGLEPTPAAVIPRIPFGTAG
jgi:hypothetical protein